MKLIAVALDVSKLTGWLNTSANCRVKVHAIRGASEVCGPGRGLEGGGAGACGAGAGAQAARTRRSRDWGQGTRDGHHKHAVHVRDAGRVEAHQLVEILRVLPSRNERVRNPGEVCRGRKAGELGRGGQWLGSGGGKRRARAVGGPATGGLG